MMVLVDTPIWWLALRRRASDLSAQQEEVTRALSELIREGRGQLIGPVRQEILSGVREEGQFHRLKEHLRGFENVKLETGDYEEAAHMNHQCRGHGVAGSATDFLTCAVAHQRGWQIFTSDRDFEHYAKVLPIKVYTPR